MSLSLVTAPAADPVTLDEAKRHLKVEHNDDDALIEGYIAAATQHLDGARGHLNRALVTQTLDWTIDCFPRESRPLRIPIVPVQSIERITYRDSAGAELPLSSGVYRLVYETVMPQIALKSGASWPETIDEIAAVTVRLVAGYLPSNDSPADPAANVPRPLKQAILLLVGHWYANREAVVLGTIATTLPLAVERLIAPYKYWV